MANLPPVYAANTISLISPTDGKLLHVSLYTGRAELRRQFKFNVKVGQNQLCITSLPNVIQADSLRVQGHGDATIHDVSLSAMPPRKATTTSPALQDLITKRDFLRSAIHRSETSSRALEDYIRSIVVHDVPLNQVGSYLETYNSHGGKIDEEQARLKKEETKLSDEITAEKARIVKERYSSTSNSELLRMQVSIGIFAENEGEIELDLVYAVSSANWEAVYDVRVDLESTERSLTLLYKAAIAQKTGEDWTNVPLTLETATPSYGVQIPTLNSLKLSVNSPYSRSPPVFAQGYSAQPVVIPHSRSRSSSRSRSRSPVWIVASYNADVRRRSRSPAPSAIIVPRNLNTLELAVTSKGDGRFNHSVFQVPGLISVPCDGMAHNVTIVELKELETKLLWLAVPKIDTRVHLSAKIKNTSEYALIPGEASVYVDGTFTARSKIPAAAPDENFDCSLGLDSSIKITYHPLSSKVSHRTPFTGITGINSLSTFGTTKTTSTLYSQRLTVLNTKRVRIDALKLLDRVPVSEDEKIVVKILRPVELNKKNANSNGSIEATTIKAGLDLNKSDDTNSLKSGLRIKRFSTNKKVSSDGKSTVNTSDTNLNVGEMSISSSTPAASQVQASPTPKARVVAQWDGADADERLAPLPGENTDQLQHGTEESGLREQGKMNWLLYDIPPQGTVNLLLEWEVSAAASVQVYEREEATVPSVPTRMPTVVPF